MEKRPEESQQQEAAGKQVSSLQLDGSASPSSNSQHLESNQHKQDEANEESKKLKNHSLDLCHFSNKENIGEFLLQDRF